MIDFVQSVKDYWGKNEYKLTAFLLKHKAPFALICPGGGYGMVCSFAEGKPYAEALNKLGYSAFVLRYRTKDRAHYPAPMDDLAQAVNYILEHADTLGVEKAGWSLWGSSAGGHLAASFGTDNMGYKKYSLPAPCAMILSYPVITMGELTHEGSKNNLLSANFTDALIETTSVEKHIHDKYPPTFVWCCKTDETVNYRNSEMLVSELRSHGIVHEFQLYETGKHGAGFAKGTEAELWFKAAVEFWMKMQYNQK